MPPEKPKAPEKDQFVEIVQWLFFIFILGNIVTNINNYAATDPLFQHGAAGLTAHGIVLDYTRPVASLFNPIGAAVIAIDDPTAVEDDAGGLIVGYQKFAASGIILQGPVEVGGVNYYDVDFQNAPDGWVAENRIAYQDGKPSIFARIVLVFWMLVSYSSYILWFLAILIVFFLVKAIRELTKLRVAYRQKLYPTEYVKVSTENTPHVSNPKWSVVMKHVESTSENDWKAAIIEADIMLADLLDTMGLVGDSIGEKLQGIDKSDFLTLDLAWEAHKVRNHIAHSGSEFALSQREARRVVELYQKVFEEFQFI